MKAARIALLFTATAALAQSPAKAPAAPTLRSALLHELQSTHNRAEWFTPIHAAVAGLTPEQAR